MCFREVHRYVMPRGIKEEEEERDKEEGEEAVERDKEEGEV